MIDNEMKPTLQRVSDFTQDLILAAKHKNHQEMLKVLREIEATGDKEMMGHVTASIWGYMKRMTEVYDHFGGLSDQEIISSMRRVDRRWKL